MQADQVAKLAGAFLVGLSACLVVQFKLDRSLQQLVPVVVLALGLCVKAAYAQRSKQRSTSRFAMTFAEPPPGDKFASSYDASPANKYAFLIPGDEELFVGGGALNGAVGKLLLKKAGQPISFELDDKGDYVMKMDPNVGREVPNYKKEECVYSKLHKSVFAKARAHVGKLTAATAEDIGSAPVQSAFARVYSDSDSTFGAAFLDIFESGKRPFGTPNNFALLYTVGPLGRNKKAEGEGPVDAERERHVKADRTDFLAEVNRTAMNVMQLVIDYNLTAGDAMIRTVRLPIVSGGTFIHPEATQVDVALALLWGLHEALLKGPSAARPAVELMPEKAFQEAYTLYYEKGIM